MSGNNNWNWKIIELFIYIAVAVVGIWLLLTSGARGDGHIFSATAPIGGLSCFFI